ncbi:hypothetical protein EON65_29355 [archaeon]|nr:MAG: hypothetical protein EON65_29355 [archaeon]
MLLAPDNSDDEFDAEEQSDKHAGKRKDEEKGVELLDLSGHVDTQGRDAEQYNFTTLPEFNKSEAV